MFARVANGEECLPSMLHAHFQLQTCSLLVTVEAVHLASASHLNAQRYEHTLSPSSGTEKTNPLFFNLKLRRILLVSVNQKGLEVCYCLWGCHPDPRLGPSRSHPGSHVVPSRFAMGFVLQCFGPIQVPRWGPSRPVLSHPAPERSFQGRAWTGRNRPLGHFRVKFLSAILGPEMAAPILWTYGKTPSFCRKTSMSIKFLVLGGDFGFGGGECRFYFYGRGDFSEKPEQGNYDN